MPDDKPTLNKEQRRRARALGVAREVLTTKGFMSSEGVDTQPLIDVARYVIEGRDPLEDYTLEVDDHVSMEAVRQAASRVLRCASIEELELELERRREGP